MGVWALSVEHTGLAVYISVWEKMKGQQTQVGLPLILRVCLFTHVSTHPGASQPL